MSSVIQTIARMRSRDELAEIINAATARDLALANQQSARKSKRVMSRYEGLKPGMQVYVHNVPRKLGNHHKQLVGKPLTVLAVRPKKKEIEIRHTSVASKDSRVTLTWSVLDRLKVSTEPTPEALAYVLNGGNDD